MIDAVTALKRLQDGNSRFVTAKRWGASRIAA